MHIRMAYPDCTLRVIELAFDMAILGKLDTESNCYENFTCQFFSNVMESYRRWAKREFSKPGVMPQNNAIQSSEKISDFAMLRWLSQEIRYIRTGKPIELVSHQLYDFLDKRGKIIVSTAEKKAYFEKAITWRAADLQREVEQNNTADNRNLLKAFRAMREQRRFTIPEYEALRRMAKKLIFYDLVQKTTNGNC